MNGFKKFETFLKSLSVTWDRVPKKKPIIDVKGLHKWAPVLREMA